MAATFSESKKCFQALKWDFVEGYNLKNKNPKECSLFELKWRRRFYRSCNFIVYRFGSFNFIDHTTPLNCINMANKVNVQLLILGNT